MMVQLPSPQVKVLADPLFAPLAASNAIEVTDGCSTDTALKLMMNHI
jgi:hypothetical protein